MGLYPFSLFSALISVSFQSEMWIIILWYRLFALADSREKIVQLLELFRIGRISYYEIFFTVPDFLQ